MLQWGLSDAGFFPCPLPIHNFVLATWMNETFWTPAETDLYLQSEPRQHRGRFIARTISFFPLGSYGIRGIVYAQKTQSNDEGPCST